MARSSTTARETQVPQSQPPQGQSQPPQGYRTDPFRQQQPRGFVPAQRTGRTGLPPPIFRDQEEEQQEPQERQSNRPQSNRPQSNRPQDGEVQPLTKSGYPDRRFKGQRELPPPEEANPEFRRARVGGTIGDMHVTIDGKPDRRFKENRGLSDEEVMSQWVDTLQEKFGRGQQRR